MTTNNKISLERQTQYILYEGKCIGVCQDKHCEKYLTSINGFENSVMIMSLMIIFAILSIVNLKITDKGFGKNVMMGI